MTQIWEKGKKPNSGLHFRQNFGSPNFFVDFIFIRCYASLYAISKKTFDPNSINWPKPSYWTWFNLVEPKFQSSIFFVFCLFLFFVFLFCFVLFCFFSKIWLSQSLDLMFSYRHVQISEEAWWLNLEQTSWQTEQPTDGKTDRRIKVIS